MSLAFKRVYIDVLPETHEAMKETAAERGMSMKGFVESLIQDACKPKSKRKTKTRRKRNAKKK